MDKMPNSSLDISHLPFRPVGTHELDVEVLSLDELRARVPPTMFRKTHRYDFHLLILLTSGSCSQLVDFKPVFCTAGTALCVRAGQAHRFGEDEDCSAILILFRPDFLPSSLNSCPTLARLANLESLPLILRMEPHDMTMLVGLAAQMQRDVQSELPADMLSVLLRHQLCAFLVRLAALNTCADVEGEMPQGIRARVERFERLAEQNFRHWHTVADYAREMRCSEKSLTRATKEIKGLTPKALLSARVTLEAMRLLAHGSHTVAEIGSELGFAEATNFVKFFKRETGTTPAGFRTTEQARLAATAG